MNFAKKNFSSDCVDIAVIIAYTQCSLEAQFTADQQIVVSFCCCALPPPSSPSISHLLNLSHVGATSRSRQQFDLGGRDVAPGDLDLHTLYEVDPLFDDSVFYEKI